MDLHGLKYNMNLMTLLTGALNSLSVILVYIFILLSIAGSVIYVRTLCRNDQELHSRQPAIIYKHNLVVYIQKVLNFTFVIGML